MSGDAEHRSEKEQLDSRDWLSPTEAAIWLGVSRNTLYEAIAQGTVPGVVRISPRRYVINKQALIDAATAGNGSKEA